MKYLVTALLVVVVVPFSVVAEDDDLTEYFSHIDIDGFSVQIYDASARGTDESLERTLKAVVELQLRSVGILVVDESFSHVTCQFQALYLSNPTSVVYKVDCGVTACLRCKKNSGSHCGTELYGSGHLGIVPKNNFRSTLRDVVKEEVDEIANKILKYRPDLRKN